MCVVVIAGGVGSFEPRKFPLKECEKFEGKSLFYSIKDKSIFKDKTISIFGGGDSALDWAIELSNTSKVNLIHRRDGFSGAESSVQKVKELNDQGKLNLYTKYQIGSLTGNEKIDSVSIKHDDGEVKEFKTDYVLGFFGLIMQLGPILDWGLNINKKTVEVNTENFETNVDGIFSRITLTISTKPRQPPPGAWCPPRARGQCRGKCPKQSGQPATLYTSPSKMEG